MKTGVFLTLVDNNQAHNKKKKSVKGKKHQVDDIFVLCTQKQLLTFTNDFFWIVEFLPADMMTH